MVTRPGPSAEAIALLRNEAARLEVEDLVDLCTAKASDPLRTSVYLEALRGRSGEAAQVAACLLCFDLARRGDERREAELHLLLPTLEHLFLAEQTGRSVVVAALTEKSTAVASLWADLVEHAARRDRRMILLPDVDTAPVMEIDLFDDEETAALEIELQDIEIDLDVDEEAWRAFDDGLRPFVPDLPKTLFCADDGDDLERVERLRDHCRSFAARVPIAAEMYAMSSLFLATHTRALGLFSRRNKARDRALVDGVTALLSLPQPPALAAGWFTRSDLPGADEHAWAKIAELLIDLAGFVAADAERSGVVEDTRPASVWAADVAGAYAKDPRSARVPLVLAEPGERRRRR